MLRATALPLFRITLIYISGLLLATFYRGNICITIIVLLILSLIYLFGCGSFRRTSRFNSIGFFLVFLIGYTNLLLNVAKNSKLSIWITNHKAVKAYTVSIERIYNRRSCKALITHIKNDLGWYRHKSYVQLYFSKQSDYKPKLKEVLLIAGTPISILPSRKMSALNSLNGFSNACMQVHRLKQIDKDFRRIPTQLFDRSSKWIEKIRAWGSQILAKELQDRQSIALTTTLLWGEKEGLTPQIRQAYADTGTIHVLAISGLHVGMIYLLAHTIFKYLLSSIGSLIVSEICTLVSLWLYGWLCDFPPSIVRAIIMISMGRVSFLMGRGTNNYNGWLASAFSLLLWDPFLLFNCSFQLSYLATLGILYLQPYIQRLITIKNYWLKKLWTATTLSIAAQATTLPLILYYFKQFPLYFIIANWVVVPAIFIILICSFGLLLGSGLPGINQLLSFSLEKLIFMTNQWVDWVAKWPMSTLSCSLVNGYYACLLYIILFSISLFGHYKKLIYPIIISLCITFYTIDHIQRIVASEQQCQLICYNDHNLSFKLKSGIESLDGNAIQSENSLLRGYSGGKIAVWHKKIMLTLSEIPTNWYLWNQTKLPVDYLMMDESLLPHLNVIYKVLNIQTLIVYAKRCYAEYYHRAIQKLNIKIIWIKPGATKSLSWAKNL